MKKILTQAIVATSILLTACHNPAQEERSALGQDYIGVHTSEGVEQGLYKIQATGVSTTPIVNAATDFLATLDEQQKSKTQFSVDDSEWRKWSNVDNGIYKRQGVSLKEMTPIQKQKAFALMAASFSAEGLQQSRDIMKTDQTLKELNNNAAYLDEELYFFTVMGEPSSTEPWGWQIDGHHLAVNFFVLGDQVVFSPAFMGAEPVITTSGKYEGNILFQEEQNLGLGFMNKLSNEQKQQAILGTKGGEDMKAAARSDNLVLDYEGIQATELTAKQKMQLLELIEVYVGKMTEGHAHIKMDEVRSHIDNTWFAWRGDVSEQAVFYYRIHSPVVLIEFDHQRPVGARSISGSRGATRNHIHTMVRTPNGNDYGKDLLKQHLENHHSHTDHSHD